MSGCRVGYYCFMVGFRTEASTSTTEKLKATVSLLLGIIHIDCTSTTEHTNNSHYRLLLRGSLGPRQLSNHLLEFFQ